MGLISGFLFLSGLLIGFYLHRLRIRNSQNSSSPASGNDVAGEHFAQILQHANDMIYFLDDRGIIIEVNEKASAVLGYSREEFLGKCVMDLRPDELKVNVGEFIKKIRTGKGIIYETEQVKKDGTRFPVEISARSFYIDGKEYLQAISRDITERKQLEKTLRISEERYRRLFEKNPNPMWIYDPKTLEFLAVNEASIKHYGYSREEFLSMTLMNLHPDEEHSQLLEDILGDSSHKTQNSNILRHKRKDGTLIFVEPLSNELILIDEKIVQLVLINDVTEKKIVQDTLSTERNQLLSIFGSIDEAIYVADMDTYELLYANNALKKIFGSHLIGEKCFSVLQGKTEPCDFCTNNIIKETNYRPYLWEFYNPVANRHFQIIDRMIKWTDGRGVRFELAIDITSRKESERILRESDARYKALVNNLPDFVLVVLNKRIVFANNIALEKSGYSLAELMGESVFKFIKSDDRLLAMEMVKRFAGGEELADFEIEILFKNGEKRIVNVKSTKIMYDKKNATLLVLTDITDHKKAEEKIELLAHAIKSTSEGVSITDMNSNLLFVNDAFTKIYGYKESELIGKNIGMVRPLGVRDGTLQKVEQMTMLGGWTGELINRKKDGTEFPILLTTSSIRNENGQSTALVGIIRDITARKKTQNALEESERRYRNIFEYSPIGIYRTTPDGEILLVNPALVNMLGFPSAEELKKINLNSYEYVLDKPRDEFLKKIEENGKIIGYETAWHKYDGTKIFVRENATIIHDQNGSTLYYEGTVEDITEKKYIEEELGKYHYHLEELVEERTAKLRSSEERFRALAENTRDIIIRLNSKLEHVYVNPVLEKYSGIPPEAVLGKTIREIGMPPSVADALESVLLNVFRTKELKRHEMQLPNKSWFDWSIIPEIDQEGNVATIVLSGRDITERIKLEESIKNALENEKILNEMKTKFISTASHEFRTPLTTVLSSAELLERYGRMWNVEKYNEHISNIKNSVDYLTQLINDVLTIGRTETGKTELNLKQIDLCEFCGTAIKDVTPLITDKHEIIFNYAAKQLHFFIDEKLLRFILINLLTNAIKYSPGGGKIKMEIKHNADLLIIKISDEGIGISEKDRKCLFEPFQRGSNIQNIPGTGLGLSIVKKSVDILKGHIEIESTLAYGSAFTIFIPAELDYSY